MHLQKIREFYEESTCSLNSAKQQDGHEYFTEWSKGSVCRVATDTDSAATHNLRLSQWNTLDK
jgi:hypothetical protein